MNQYKFESYCEKQAAEFLNISISFLRADRLRARPNVPFFRIGKAVRYSKDALLEIVNKK